MTYAEAMSRLTERDQDLIGLRDGGSKWKAIAEIHGISVNYAMVLYKKAKAEVERLMAEPEQTPPDPLPAPAEAIPEAAGERVFPDADFKHPQAEVFELAKELGQSDALNEQAREQEAQSARDEMLPRTMVVTGVPQRVAIVRGVPREEPIEMPQRLTAPWKKVELK